MDTGEVLYLLLVVGAFLAFSASVLYAMHETKDLGSRH
ncbi:hypothetical protein GGE65_006697 [Skermanella aerolata]|jgi:hypothetical protein|nr:hypothetical protein N826_19010 [Skermanella aerolata KACC 11604]